MTTMLLTIDKMEKGDDVLIITETAPVSAAERVFKVTRVHGDGETEVIAEPYLSYDGDWLIEPVDGIDIAFSELKEIMATLETLTEQKPVAIKAAKGGAK